MNKYLLGIDIGSTTIKVAVLDKEYNILYSDYKRHYANIQNSLFELILDIQKLLGDCILVPTITGSGGLSLSSHIEIPFVQELIAVSESVKKYAPLTNVAIELGGEDAKILYFEGVVEHRMNGVCAGGTGAFIDQMASLLQTDASGLNEYAKNYTSLYPIAARCGVFAKSDIQPLINEGATKEDLAASIFNAVVKQTISGLACGKPIRGYITFLGGPLHFLTELKQAFVRTLNLDDEHALTPDNSHLFAAMGSALIDGFDNKTEFNISDLIKKLSIKIELESETARMEALFSSEEDYEEFKNRHNKHKVKKSDLSTYEGRCFLGIDAGSTTTKVAVIGQEGELLYSFYSNNNGSPIKTIQRSLQEIQNILPDSANLAYSCSTGYGEAISKSAFLLDEGEVETVAHYYGASFFNPNVDCILDIGGQDMKCIKIRNNSIYSVLLNEACSAGCGSFIESFAKSLNYDIRDFAKAATDAKNPIDLGSRCTVFMNSNVKQAQKEGTSVEDISAGLSYSVVKNTLYKVIKVHDAKELGENIVVQGGTFYNDSVLRAFEKISNCQVIRPDIAGIMGAFGAALIARERYKPNKKTTLINFSKSTALEYTTEMSKCKLCTNSCTLTTSTFDSERKFISGNRCERGLGLKKSTRDIPNLYKYKNKRLFSYTPLSKKDATMGTIGIPRVLNMYENYPFWFTFFNNLGYRVVLSPPSSSKIYEMGLESIPSESECYPAKLVHGHIMYLIKQGVKTIFYPCIPFEHKEISEAENHFNCPIVTSYSENIKNNIEDIKEQNIEFLNPFISFESRDIITSRLIDIFQNKVLPNNIITAAAQAWEELMNSRKDVHLEGERALEYIEKNGIHGIILAGRPYHIDEEINHGIPELINSYDVAVLTEDSISHLAKTPRLKVVNQWMYHSRLYAAAEYVKDEKSIDLIQLNSFGCGLDAVTTDQVEYILKSTSKIYTSLKIDEVNNLGAARIRIRSLLAAIKLRKEENFVDKVSSSSFVPISFNKEMQKKYTILAPQMSPIHFSLLEAALKSDGINLEVLHNDSKGTIDVGLKYVNNDACYPALIVVGQIVDALLSGKYDLKRTAVMISQTGGGCRASNYIGFIRSALEKASLKDIPIVSVNVNGLEMESSLKISPTAAIKATQAIVYGDVFMRVLYRMRPYEVIKGSANKLHKYWEEICVNSLLKKGFNFKEYKKNIVNIIREFDELEIQQTDKPKVGIVGEILVKFLPLANNHLVELLEKEGAEVVVPDLLDFFQYCLYNKKFNAKYLGKSREVSLLCRVTISALEFIRSSAKKAFNKSVHFSAPLKINHIAKLAKPYVSLGNQTGEGWFLTGEIIELINSGASNVVCVQPFACLPNHIVGKGVIKEIRKFNTKANIISIDYDPGSSEVNQLNRIKLMLANAKSNKIKEVRGHDYRL